MSRLTAKLIRPVPCGLILGAMFDAMPRPELWTRIFALLGALRARLRETAPERFASMAAEARARLVAITALVRRYIHALAADIALPPRTAAAPGDDAKRREAKGRPSREPLFRLTELTSAAQNSATGAGSDTPYIRWALMFEAARRLNAVMADPQKHAVRLARLLRRRTGETLKAAPVPLHVLRRLPPWIDALLCRLDAEAQPEAWAGINAQGPPLPRA